MPKHFSIAGFFLLVALVLVPRFLDLNVVVMSDEHLWVDRSVRFFHALSHLDTQGTKLAGHPGVTTMWLGAAFIGARTLLGAYTWQDFFLPGKLAIGLSVVFLIAAAFWPLKRLFGTSVAVLAVLLLALDPFLLAHSRVLHLDALLACLMLLSLALFLASVGSEHEYRYQVISGIALGLAIATKLPALFLLPFFALLTAAIGFHEFLQRGAWRRAVSTAATRFIVVAVPATFTLMLVWPALWTDPFHFLRLLAGGPGIEAHEHGQYFLGRAVPDPGALFYLFVVAFRSTPLSLTLALVAIGSCLAHLFSRFRRTHNLTSRHRAVLALIAYIVLFIVFMSIPGKKMDRYILPVFPALDVLAAVGAVSVIGLVKSFLRNPLYRLVFPLLLLSLALWHIYSFAQIHPYYLAYYNPLFGGGETARGVLLIGRGEGLDKVAEYLNRKPNAERLLVATEFPEILSLKFKGQVRTTKVEQYQNDTLEWADYLVVYVAGLQKGPLRLPKEVLRVHADRIPEQIVTINGIEYAYLYSLR